MIKEEPQSTEENKENNQENQGNSGENKENEGGEGEGQQGGEGDQKPEAGDEYTATINTFGASISSFANAAGVQVDTDLSSGASNAEKLTACLQAQLKYEECLSGAWFSKINTALWDGSCIVQVGTGNPAKDNFNPGTFKWNSTAKIYKVEVTAMCYAKAGYSEDSLAKIKINDDSAEALKVENEELEFKTIVKEYEEGINALTIQSIDGRVLLKALKITWRF